MNLDTAKRLGRAFKMGMAFAKGRNHVEAANMAMDRWITIHPFGKGRNADFARIFINDETGIIETGAGGKFNGKTLKQAFSREKEEEYNPARLPGERKEVEKVKPKHRAGFKDDAKPETQAFMDEFAKGMSKAKSNLDFEFYGQGAMQKALNKLPDGTVFVNNYEYGYYLKQDGQWYKKDYETPDGYIGMDVTEPPNFADTGMNGKLFFGIGGNLKQAEANKNWHEIVAKSTKKDLKLTKNKRKITSNPEEGYKTERT